MTNPTLVELRKIRSALDRPSVSPVFVDYATAARMLCTSKRSVERLVSERRLKTYNIAGPKLRVVDLRKLGERKPATRRRTPPAKKTARDELRTLVAAKQEGAAT